MNKNRALIVLAWLATLAMAAWAWGQVPDGTRIPIHWDIHGRPNGWGGKAEAFLVCPVMLIFVTGVLALAARLEPRKEHVAQSREALESIAMMVAVFMAVIQGTLVSTAVGHPIDVGRVVLGSIGLLFAGMGNLMGKLRSNHFAGFRTPWTLSSERSWSKTHRLGGRLFVVTGVGTALLGLANQPTIATAFLMVSLLISLVVTVWYSHKVWKDDPDKKS